MQGSHNLIQEIPPRGVASGTSMTCATDLSGSVALLYATDFAYDTATKTKLESTTRSDTDPDLGQQRTATTKLEYTDPANPGLVTRVIPPRGNTGSSPDYSYAITSTYFTTGSRAGLLEGTTDALGNKTSYDYNAVGLQTKMVDANGNALGGVQTDHTWQYTYSNEDRLRFSKAPPPTAGGSQLVTEFRYDVVGNRRVMIDANGQVTKYEHDERDSLKQVLESPSPWTNSGILPSDMITTEYAYDHAGNLARVMRAKGDTNAERVVDYAYDGLNRLRKEIQYPSWPITTTTLLTEYTYDRNGNRLTVRDPLGQTTTYDYDALNRLTAITYSDGQTPNVTYTYDADGNRLSMQDGTGTTSYTYDQQGRLTVAGPVTATVQYRYDLDGNRTKLGYPGAITVTYSFDKAGRLGSMTDWGVPPRTTSYQYNPDNSLKTITNTNTTVASFAYDKAQRLQQIQHRRGVTTTSQYTYTLDAVGNRTRADELLPQLDGTTTPSITDYTYDRLYRLTGSTAPITVTSYSYDNVGNRLSMVRGITTTYAYDRADRIQQAGSVTYTMNANGNLVARGADTFTYDQANRLKSAVIGGTTTTYVYDGDGKRVSKTGGTTTSYVYDVNGSLPVLLDDGARRYVWGLGLAYLG